MASAAARNALDAFSSPSAAINLKKIFFLIF
jgi:hypothetical protein